MSAYAYDRTDELTSQLTGGVPLAASYDARGNLLAAPDPAGRVTAYAVDEGDRLVSTTPQGQGATTFTLDALGRTATRVTPAGTDTYAYLGRSGTAWQVANASLTVSSAIDARGDRLAVRSGATTGLTLPDLHGSVAAELDATRTGTLSALRYDPWGLVADAYDAGSAFANPWTYQGRLELSPDPSRAAARHGGPRLQPDPERVHEPRLGRRLRLEPALDEPLPLTCRLLLTFRMSNGNVNRS